MYDGGIMYRHIGRKLVEGAMSPNSKQKSATPKKREVPIGAV